MKARRFDYLRVATLPDAFAAYAAADGQARYLAGGQSLLPAMALRLDAPDLLIDIAHIEALRGVARVGDRLRIGALTRHAEVLRDAVIAEHAPLFALAAPHIAHPAIRNKGTLGGSIALADPASEFPAVALALAAEIEIAGPRGTRSVAADRFFRGLYQTALEPGEIIAAISVPCRRSDQRAAFGELARRRGDYAMVGLAAAADVPHGIVQSIRLAFLAVGPTPVRAARAEQALIGGPIDAVRIVAARIALSGDLDPADDPTVSRATRLHLAGVLLGRVLGDLAGAAPAKGAAR